MIKERRLFGFSGETNPGNENKNKKQQQS
jgi:hypothetical protein